MPFPPGFPTVTVTKDYRVAIGDPPLRASVTFAPSARKVVVSPALTIEPVAVTVSVPSNGLLSVTLAATEGFSYQVTERVNGKQRPPFSVLLPAGTSPVVLDSLAPIEPVIPAYTPVRTVEGIGPDPLGNIDLPASGGSAPNTRLIATTGGIVGGGDLSADRTLSLTYGTLANTVMQGNDPRGSDARAPLAHAHPQSDVTGLGASLAGKENVGVAATADVAHVIAVDPHPQYLTAAEGNAAYAASVHAHVLGDVTGLIAALAAKAGKLVCREAYVTSGNVNLNTGTGVWGPLPTFPTLSIPAVVGDKVGFEGSMGRQPNGNLLADVGVVVGGAIKRWLGGPFTDSAPPATPGYEGDIALYHTGGIPARSGERRFTVTAGDLDAGNVVFAVLCRVAGGGSAVILSDPATPFYWQATNYGATS